MSPEPAPAVVEEAPAPKRSSAAPIYFPNDKVFGEALDSIPQATRTRLSDLLRANFKYLETLELEEKEPVVAQDEPLPDAASADLELDEEE